MASAPSDATGPNTALSILLRAAQTVLFAGLIRAMLNMRFFFD